MKTDIKNNTINLYDIPTGKQSFIATVDCFDCEEQYYNGWSYFVDYIFFKDVQILQDNTWHKVECPQYSVKSKIGKKLKKLDLKVGDTLSFDANVENADIPFNEFEEDVKTKKEAKDDYLINCLPIPPLPKSYDGYFVLDIYETTFSLSSRLSKYNYQVLADSREELHWAIKEFNSKIPASSKHDGIFREIQCMYFCGKTLKNFSKLKLLRRE